MGLVVDTSAFVDLERTDSSVRTCDRRTGATQSVMPAIVLAELLCRSRSSRRRRSRACRGGGTGRCGPRAGSCRGLRSRRLPTSVGGAVRVDYGVRVRTMPANDVSVAATRSVAGLGHPGRTRDEAHFRRVPGLGVRELTRRRAAPTVVACRPDGRGRLRSSEESPDTKGQGRWGNPRRRKPTESGTESRPPGHAR